MAIKIAKERQDKICSRRVLSKIGVVMLPFLLLFCSIHIISFINYQYYGVYTTNQLNNSNYTKAAMLMMKIKPEKEIEHVEITRETLRRLYEVSPSLKILEEIIEVEYENKNGLVMAGEDNGEINEDLITWELTGAASQKGYYKDAQTAEKFWGDVYTEIKQAVDEGKLETRATLPSRSLIPFPSAPGSFGKLISSIISLYGRAATYENSIMVVDKVNIDEAVARRYEAIAGGYAVREEIAVGVADPMEVRAERFVKYASWIKKIYKLISPVLLATGIIYYVGLTIFVIIGAVKKRVRYFDRWLFLSAIFGGLTVMLIGLGYVNAFMVDVNGYIASANGLLNMFVALTFGLVVQDAIYALSRWRKSHSSR